jgi:hypothetical protein
MFYNLYRSTKQGREESEKAKLSGAGKNVINTNPKERLLNFQKRKKLKELLISKFMNKFGLNQPDPTLDNEVTKFIQAEKLTDKDLQRLDSKLKTIYDTRKRKQKLKSTLTQTLLERNNTINANKSQPDFLPQIQEPKQIQEINTNTNVNMNTINQDIPQQREKKLRPSASVEVISRKRKIYRDPEEELAELEAEFAEEEKKRNTKRNFIRLDFSDVGDEWQALAKYNKKMYEQYLQKEKEKDAEVKKRTKEI